MVRKTRTVGYNAKAIDDAIASSNRAGRRIGDKERKLIHSLLQGRSTTEVKTNPRRKPRRLHRNPSTRGDSSHTSTVSPTKTSTSTDAYTRGNVTVTGGAGRGATTTVKLSRNKKRKKNAYRPIANKRRRVARRKTRVVRISRNPPKAIAYMIRAKTLSGGFMYYNATREAFDTNRNKASHFTLTAAKREAQRIHLMLPFKIVSIGVQKVRGG